MMSRLFYEFIVLLTDESLPLTDHFFSSKLGILSFTMEI